MNTIHKVAKKEINTFFSSPIAFIFIGVFLVVNLFVFFWVETFFAVNITEVRPLFKWMPILLIFLAAAITMRSWAEEKRGGTLEFLLTSSVAPVSLVLGKFLACLFLVVVSLVLTLSLPLTVSFMGPLDWGPVFGGYLATLFLAAAYIAVGLFVSAKSENQIVSLIITTLICTLFYLIGSDTLVAFFGTRTGEILQLLGSGSRFDSITRGIIDFRDLYYYLCVVAVFLTLNVYGLEKMRWEDNPENRHHRSWKLAVVLLVLNFLAANFWLSPVRSLRSDLTRGNIYSISEATRSYLQQIKEPLLIRGYFSPQTHPLLSPLVPRLRDLLKEYGVVGGDKVRVEFVNPIEHPELEQEAGQKYGIRPVPFQTASKYQSSVTNSYFDILVRYGDQFETLSFRDLIELKSGLDSNLEVELRNPEYDITRAIKKVLYSYQGGGDIFSNIARPLSFTGYISPDESLPEELVQLKNELIAVLEEIKQDSDGKFTINFVDPDGDNGEVAEKISREYGFQPLAASLFDDRNFWYYLTLTGGEQIEEIPLPEDLSKDGLKRAIESGLKRFATGFTKTVALYTPPGTPAMPQYGMPARGAQFNVLKEVLSTEHVVIPADLKGGRVPGETDILLLAAPEDLDEKQLFAVDQFLMQGGTVVLATSPFKAGLEQQLSLESQKSGLEEWLGHYGIEVDTSLVFDPQNSAFPVPVERQVAGFSIRETQLVNYPLFVDIRKEGMNSGSGLTGGLEQITMNWASPVDVDEEKNRERKVTRLLESSAKSWNSPALNVQPDFERYPEMGFATGEEAGGSLLGVAVEGRFTSFFAGRKSPLTEEKTEAVAAPSGEEQAKEEEHVYIRQLDKSPETARIVLFASNSFLRDVVLSIGSSVMQTSYLNPVQLMENVVDWSLEDRGLLSIRGRSHFSRSLYPMTGQVQRFWELMNYGLTVAGLLVVWLVRRTMVKNCRERQQSLIDESVGRI